MKDKTLRTGAKAYLDTFSGLVPVKVIAVTAPKSPPMFDLMFGGAKASIQVTAEVTSTVGAYKKGEVVSDDSIHVVPRGSVKSTSVGTFYITAYDVVPD